MEKLVLDFLKGKCNILQVPTNNSKIIIKQSVLSSIEKNQKQQKTIELKLIFSNIAAAIIILITISTFIYPTSNWRICTKSNNRIEHTLPDKSIIALNCNSYITFNAFSYSNNREVFTEGEIYLKVLKGQKFVVNIPHGKVEVLGTEFNVYSRGDKFEVRCHSGLVKVSNHVRSQVLSKYDLAYLDDQLGLQKTSFEEYKLNHNWINGEFYYKNTPLNEIIEELERQFEISFEIKTSIDRMYTGYFSNRELTKALKMVFDPLGIKFYITDSNVTIE